MENDFNFLVYQTAQENVSVNALVKDETIWLTQKAMAELFDVDKSSISRHLKNIFNEGELDEKVVVAKIATTTQHGAIEGKTQSKETQFYNLDAIISVGYRVNSKRATRFRIWATGILKEYMIKGFAMDDERLKQGKTAFGKDYFRELLERVRSIRASERRIWQQITDIFAECSIDYDKNAQITHDFYAMVQNKFHFAITGQTAAEIVYTYADRTKENMGLTTWKNAQDGRILKSDVVVAKNYLEEKQIRQLERAVT
ncbi:RhuM family protein, partial [Peptoniphilus asaccharolyticus]